MRTPLGALRALLGEHRDAVFTSITTAVLPRLEGAAGRHRERKQAVEAAAAAVAGSGGATRVPPASSWWRWLAFSITAIWAAVEVVVGLRTSSAAVLADGILMAQAAVAMLVVSAVRPFLGRMSHDARRRADAMLGVTVGLLLGASAIGVIAGAGAALLDPEVPDGRVMLAVSAIGFAVNLLAIHWLKRGSGASDLALLADTRTDVLASLAGMAAAFLVLVSGSARPDLIGAAAIALLMLWRANEIVRGSAGYLSTIAGGVQSLPLTGKRVVQVLVLGICAGVVQTHIVYGPLTIAGSLGDFVGVTPEQLVLIVSLGGPAAQCIVLPLARRWPSLSWLTVLATAALSGVIGLFAEGRVLVVLLVLTATLFIAPFAVWTALAQTFTGVDGRRAESLFVAGLLSTSSALSFAYAELVGDRDGDQVGRIRTLYTVVAVVLVMAAFGIWRLTPRQTADRGLPVRSLLRGPWTQLRIPLVRRVATMAGLSGAVLAALDATITLVLISYYGGEGETLSALTGVAVVVGGLLGPTLNLLGSLRVRMLASAAITLIAFPLAALATGEASVFVTVGTLVVARCLVEIGTTGTTTASPGVAHGDTFAMAVIQAVKAVSVLGGAATGAAIMATAPFGLPPWQTVMGVATAVTLIAIWLGRGLPRGVWILQRTEAGAYVFRSGDGLRTLVLQGNPMQQLEQGLRGIRNRPAQVLAATATAGDGRATGAPDALSLDVGLLAEIRSLARLDPRVTGVRSLDVVWHDSAWLLVIGVEVGRERQRRQVERALARRLKAGLPVQRVLVVERYPLGDRIPIRRRVARGLRTASRWTLASLAGRFAQLRPGPASSVMRMWTREGDVIGVGNRLEAQIAATARRCGAASAQWGMAYGPGGWTLEVEVTGLKARGRRRLAALLSHDLGLTGARGVLVRSPH